MNRRGDGSSHHGMVRRARVVILTADRDPDVLRSTRRKRRREWQQDQKDEPDGRKLSHSVSVHLCLGSGPAPTCAEPALPLLRTASISAPCRSPVPED